MVTFVPSIIDIAVAQALEGGAPDAAMIEKWVRIMTYAGVVTGPIMNAIIGAIITGITALVVKK